MSRARTRPSRHCGPAERARRDPAARERITDLAQGWAIRRQLPVEVTFPSLTGSEVTVAVDALRANGSRRVEADSLMVAGGRLYELLVRRSTAALGARH